MGVIRVIGMIRKSEVIDRDMCVFDVIKELGDVVIELGFV